MKFSSSFEKEPGDGFTYNRLYLTKHEKERLIHAAQAMSICSHVSDKDKEMALALKFTLTR